MKATQLIAPCCRFVISKMPLTRCYSLKALMLSLMGVKVGKEVRVCSNAVFYGTNTQLGAGTFVGFESMILSTFESSVSIGARCDIAPRCMILVGSHEIGDASRRAGLDISSSIKIEDGCWLCAGVIVKGGVTIGAGSIIAAGAVVVNDVPPNSLYGGVPAKLIRRL